MTKTIAIVEYLGRGGIAQTSESWRRALESQGRSAHVLSRPSEYWAGGIDVDRRWPGALGALRQHRGFVGAVIEDVEQRRPSAVLIQNYLVPRWELEIVRACQAISAKVVTIVHNHQPHDRRSGLTAGLGRLLRESDHVVAHSNFVSQRVAELYDVKTSVVSLPTAAVVVDADEARPPELVDDRSAPTVVTFGGLRRRYKNGDLLSEIAPNLPSTIRLIAAGPGASSRHRRVQAVDRFLSDGELLWLVRRASVVVLPYRRATQSAAVVLAQSVGALPVVSAVGGIPEQVNGDDDGILMAPEASASEWAASLCRQLLRIEDDPGLRSRTVSRARQRDGEALNAMVGVVEGLSSAAAQHAEAAAPAEREGP